MSPSNNHIAIAMFVRMLSQLTNNSNPRYVKSLDFKLLATKGSSVPVGGRKPRGFTNFFLVPNGQMRSVIIK